VSDLPGRKQLDACQFAWAVKQLAHVRWCQRLIAQWAGEQVFAWLFNQIVLKDPLTSFRNVDQPLSAMMLGLVVCGSVGPRLSAGVYVSASHDADFPDSRTSDQLQPKHVRMSPLHQCQHLQ
jgi:hypothetical protein